MLWFYIVDHCDNIGLCELDLGLVSKDCDLKITEAHLIELGDRVQRICNGKVYVTKFIPFQYGTLSAECKPHKKIIEAIKFHSLTPNFKGYQYPTMKGMDTLQEKEEEKEQEKEKDKEEEKDRKRKGKGTEQEISDYCREIGLYPRDAEYLWNKWEGTGWMVSGKAIKDWRATVRSWKLQGYLPSQKSPSPSDCWPSEPSPQNDIDPSEELRAKLEWNIKARKEREAAEQAELCEAPEDIPPHERDYVW